MYFLFHLFIVSIFEYEKSVNNLWIIRLLRLSTAMLPNKWVKLTPGGVSVFTLLMAAWKIVETISKPEYKAKRFSPKCQCANYRLCLCHKFKFLMPTKIRTYFLIGKGFFDYFNFFWENIQKCLVDWKKCRTFAARKRNLLRMLRHGETAEGDYSPCCFLNNKRISPFS
jgi:hypothetical protein